MSDITFIRPDSGQQRSLAKPRITIGSSAQCDLQLQHPSVLPEHAVVRVRGGEVSVIGTDPEVSLDLDGLPVIGVRQLKSGSTLTVGDVKLKVVWQDARAEEETQKTLDSGAVLAAAEEETQKALDSNVVMTAASEEKTQALDSSSMEAVRSAPQIKPEELPSSSAQEAATQLLSAFEAIERARKVEERREKEATQVLRSQDALDAAEASSTDADGTNGSVHEDDLDSEPLRIGSASERVTEGLDQEQVDAIYRLYEKHRKQQADSDQSSDSAFSLSEILEMGPQAFGVKTWDEVASEAAAETPEEDEPWAGLALLRDAEDKSIVSRVLMVTMILLLATLTALFWLIPAEPVDLEAERPIDEVPIEELDRVEHEDAAVRCFTEAECRELAKRELSVAKAEWENRSSTYDNTFRAFEHADRARVMVESAGLDMGSVEGLEPFWTKARDEVDALFESLRVSFFIEMSQKHYPEALDVLRLTQAYFPSPRSRAHRWAQQMILTFKERGIETKIQHRRAVIGRWN